MKNPPPSILAVCVSAAHTMSKPPVTSIRLLKGLGVEGDAHMGKTVKHRSRVAADPTNPNLRQVHLMHNELFEELEAKGMTVTAGQMGENITTQGVALLDLPLNTLMKIGPTAVIRITGLRNPCLQLNGIVDGLLKAVLDKDEEGNLIHKAGVMGVVEVGGDIKAGDTIELIFPELPHHRLERV